MGKFVKGTASSVTSKNVGKTIGKILAHEATHRLKETAGDAYVQYRDYVLQTAAHAKEGAVQTSIDAYVQQYAEKKNLSNEQAMDEIVADYTQNFLEDSKLFKDFVSQSQENLTIGEKIAKFFRELLEKVKSAFSKKSEQNTVLEKNLGLGADAVNEALHKWEDAIKEAKKTVRKTAATEKGKTSTGRDAASEAQHAINASKEQYIGYVVGEVTQTETEKGIEQVAKMKAVAKLNGNEFTTAGRTLIGDVTKFFEKIGGMVHNKRLGDVHLRKRGVKDDLAHGMTPEKAAAFAALPEVIRNGKVVYYEKNWKNRGYDTATIAAPVDIGNEPYMMAVVVHRTNGENHFYIHDVFAEKEAAPFMTGTFEEGTSGGATSTVSIIAKILDVKEKLNTSSNDTGILSVEGTENILNDVLSGKLKAASDRYGNIPKGENPTRDVDVPVNTDMEDKDKRVSLTIRTALEAGVTPDVMIPAIQKDIIEGKFSDNIQHNKALLARADNWVKGKKTTDNAVEKWMKIADKGTTINSETSVAGMLLYTQLATEAANAEDVETQEKYIRQAIDMITEVAALNREAARIIYTHMQKILASSALLC